MAKEHLIVVRVDAATHKKIKQLAEDDKRSMSSFVRIQLEEKIKPLRPKERFRA